MREWKSVKGHFYVIMKTVIFLKDPLKRPGMPRRLWTQEELLLYMMNVWELEDSYPVEIQAFLQYRFFL
jgi:hypothetical protein